MQLGSISYVLECNICHLLYLMLFEKMSQRYAPVLTVDYILICCNI